MSIETVVDFGANGAAWKPFDDGRSGTRCTFPERLSIAQVAPLYESVPPKLYGGTERVVSYLTEELVSESEPLTPEKVQVPTVLLVMIAFVLPPAKVRVLGNRAFASLEEFVTMTLELVTTLKYESTALIVLVYAAPAIWPLGVPLCPVVLAGTPVSPGTRICSALAVAGATTTLEPPELA